MLSFACLGCLGMVLRCAVVQCEGVRVIVGVIHVCAVGVVYDH